MEISNANELGVSSAGAKYVSIVRECFAIHKFYTTEIIINIMGHRFLIMTVMLPHS